VRVGRRGVLLDDASHCRRRLPAASGHLDRADIAARLISDAWGKTLGQSVIVENRAGASGNIGMAAVARAEPNGYTLAINTMSLAINPALFRNVPFDTARDLRSVGTVGTSQHVLTVSPSLPVNNVKELLDYIRARPANELSFGSAGTGSTFHMAAELFKSVSGTQILHVPYKGGGPAMVDTISGQVQMSFPVLSAVVDTLNVRLAQALQSAELSERMRREGFDPLVSTPAETDAMVKGEMTRWAGIVKDAGIEAN